MTYKIGDIIEYEHDTTKQWTIVSVEDVPNWKGYHGGNLLVISVNLLDDGAEGKKTMSFFSHNEITTRKISVRRSYK